MLKRDRRGVSSVVTMMFIILGTIIGAAILWGFVTRTTDSRGGEVVDPDCLTVSLEMVECKAYGSCAYYFGSSGYDADVLVKRNVGQGNVTGLRFIFEDGAGRKAIHDVILNKSGKNLTELGSVQLVQPYSIPVLGNPIDTKLRVVALLGEKKDVCPIQSNTIRCPAYSPILPYGDYANNTDPTGTGPVINNRVGNCCRHPINITSNNCYNGGDPAYVFDPVTHVYLNGSLLPPGNTTICCQRNPHTGGPVEYVV